jgi:hypothetical protein
VAATESALPSAKPKVPVAVQWPSAGHVGGVVTSDPRTGILNAIERIAVRASGGPPGVAGGCAVTVSSEMVSRSKPGDSCVPGAVMTSMIWFGPLKTWSSPGTGSSGGPKPVTALKVPRVSAVSAGHASAPRTWSSASEAVHSPTAVVS